jgi:hypothetical protein
MIPMPTPMRYFRTSLCLSVLLFGLSAGCLLANSSVTVSELEKTSATEGSLLLTLNTDEKEATAFETEFVFDPARVEVTAPGSLQVPGATDEDFSVDSFNVSDGRLRVVLSSSRLKYLGDGTTFRVPVRAAKDVASIDAYFPVAVTDMELSNVSAKAAKPKVGTSLRVKRLQNGERLSGKSGVSLGLELLKDDSVQVSRIEYLADGKVVKESSSMGDLTWTPPGSGAFRLSARVTLKDGSKIQSKATSVVVTGLGTTPVRGSYTGIVQDGSSKKAAGATGTVQISTSTSGSAGSYSMRLVLNGMSLSSAGKFNSESVATPSVVSKATGVPKTYRLYFQQEATGFGDAVSGVVTDGTITATGEPSGGSFASNFVANRNVWAAGVNETGAMAGRYTLALPLRGEVSDAPHGISLLTVSSSGMVVGRFSLSDGTRASVTGTLSKEGAWQPYTGLYARTGFLTGILDFTDKGQAGVLGGDLDWRLSDSSLVALEGLGEKFTPVTRSPIFSVRTGVGNVVIDISGGGLAADLSQTATLTPTSLLLVPQPNAQKLNFRIDRVGGGFSGSFTVPGDAKATQVTGVVLQREARAIGYFVRNGVRGFVSITAAP